MVGKKGLIKFKLSSIMIKSIHYVYIYLDNRKPGSWEYKGIVFEYQPFYVGKGKRRRIFTHLEEKSLEEFNLKNYIIKKILAIGQVPIHYKIFENLTDEESKRIEIEIIEHFGRKDLGTGILANLTNGGDGPTSKWSDERKANYRVRKGAESIRSKVVAQYTKEWELIKKWASINEAARGLNVSVTSISGCCNGHYEFAHGFRWKFTNENWYIPVVTKKKVTKVIKKIFRYSLAGDFIKEYPTHASAIEELGVKIAFEQVKDTDSKRKGADSLWFSEYQGEKVKPYPFITHCNEKTIDCFDLDMNLIKTYPSRKEAYKEHEKSSVSKALRDGTPTKNLFYFKYHPSDL